MSLLGRNSLRMLSAIRLSSMASTSVAVPRFNHRLQAEPARRLNSTSTYQRTMFNLTGHNKYGLYTDDMYIENEDVVEALRRLPLQLQDERAFRIMRALHYSMLKTILPKEEWVTYDEDQEKGYYLKPYLDEVIKEREEREAWAKL